MSKIALATAIVALAAVVPLMTGRAEAQPPASFLPPGAAPPWANSTTTTTTTQTNAASTPTETPAALAEVPTAQPAQTATPPDTTMTVPVNATPMQGMTTPLQAVSLRAGPNTSFPVVGTLHPGTPLQVLATANHGWMQVQSPEGAGWAYGSYLAPSGAATEAQPPPAPPPEVIER